MTKCNKSEVNLKSTAYNQNGQNYFEQLTAYNSMSAHLRRVLLAKCAVDARNEGYMRKRKQASCKPIDLKPRFVRTEITGNIIDRLAYDTSNHPADFLRMNNDSKYFCQCEAQKYFATCYDYDAICSRSRAQNHAPCPNLSTLKANTANADFASNSKNVRRRSYVKSRASSRKIFRPTDAKSGVKIQDRYEENSMFYESASDFLSQDTNHLSSTVSTTRSSANYETTEARTDASDDQKVQRKNEEEKYAKFVYDITQEIIQKCLYTDEELQEVFKRHVKKNKELLDMQNRMQYEIVQLKVALNILDNSDDEELEDLVYSQKLLNISTARPPTPPKILNLDRVTEKLQWQEKLDDVRRDSLNTSNKTVLLVDANPELHVTERDVLTSLIEAHIHPEEARKIYRRLSFKSKDLFPIGTLKLESNGEDETDEEVDDDLPESSNASNETNELEKSSTTDDLVTREHRDVQV